MDPETARKELAALDEIKEIGKITASELTSKNTGIWKKWLTSYKEALQQMDPSITDQVRRESMDAINPKFVLRNYLLEEAIRAAEASNDFTKVEELLKMSYNPYDEKNISEIST